ncbi:PEP/pyruvate-binding domain-containing protein [Pseudonocardia sp. T1-2H]|uniref:PEP/pyruvate-binding domain-containing protein n=1 Tax=Pseudonocardia sp. T1-2H TaxID=3128899 RepID=UPI00310186E7
MVLGEVVGRVWADRQLPTLAGRRLVLVRSLDDGSLTVAVDLVEVGAGVTVLVSTDEAAAAASGESTIDAAVVALVADYDARPAAGIPAGERVTVTASDVVWIGSEGPGLTANVVGGKGRGLDMLVRAGLRVPEAFAVSTLCYRRAVTGTLAAELDRRMGGLAPDTDIAELDAVTEQMRALVFEATADHPADQHIRAAYQRLCEQACQEDAPVAVRSSSAAEDGGERSFAGEHDTYLWVVGADAVAEHVRRCWVSLFTSRAVAYTARSDRSAAAPAERDAMAVVVQRMVDARSAGVFMTLNPANGDRSKIVVESVWGLGEPLVSGAVTPDRFTIDKVTGEVVLREIVNKSERTARDPRTDRAITTLPVPDADRGRASLSDAELAELRRMGRIVEKFAGSPQDGEFAVAGDGGPDQVFLVQARPETVWSSRQVRRVTQQPGDVLHRVVAALTRPSASA